METDRKATNTSTSRRGSDRAQHERSRILDLVEQKRRGAEALRDLGKVDEARALENDARKFEHAYQVDELAFYERILGRSLRLKDEAVEATGIPYTTLNDKKNKGDWNLMEGEPVDTVRVRDLPCRAGYLAKLIGAPGREPENSDGTIDGEHSEDELAEYRRRNDTEKAA